MQIWSANIHKHLILVYNVGKNSKLIMDNIFISLARNVADIFYGVAENKSGVYKEFACVLGWVSSSTLIFILYREGT